MSQGLLNFKIDHEKSSFNLIGFSGLMPFFELAKASGLLDAMKKLNLKSQGWDDADMLMSLLFVNLSGGDAVSDIERLEGDSGLCKLLKHVRGYYLGSKQKRLLAHRWRKPQERSFPSQTAIHHYLSHFHNDEAKQNRLAGNAYIPEKNEALKALSGVNKSLILFAQTHHPQTTATLDMDATLSETHKKSALYSYKGMKAYQPVNTYWAEQKLLVHTEFRDGNVPACFELQRVLQESLSRLPDGIRTVRFRADSAAYQKELLQYCAKGMHPKYGALEFAISIKVSLAFKEAVAAIPDEQWHTLYKTTGNDNHIATIQEWADVSFVPNWVAQSNTNPEYRYIAIREPLAQQLTLEGIETIQGSLPFPSMEMNERPYKVFGVVTNLKEPGQKVINWHRGRCGESEQVHLLQKTDLAGGQFPSNKFGVNAAWWLIMVMAFNLNRVMQHLVLKGKLKNCQLKAMRYHFICLPGKLVRHAREWIIKIDAPKQAIARLVEARETIKQLAQGPPIPIH